MRVAFVERGSPGLSIWVSESAREIHGNRFEAAGYVAHADGLCALQASALFEFYGVGHIVEYECMVDVKDWLECEDLPATTKEP
jgi:hypothetical protein